jgi:hypothetical protein
MQRIYESEINRMQDMIDHSASAREAAQATKRREKLTKQLKETTIRTNYKIGGGDMLIFKLK